MLIDLNPSVCQPHCEVCSPSLVACDRADGDDCEHAGTKDQAYRCQLISAEYSRENCGEAGRDGYCNVDCVRERPGCGLHCQRVVARGRVGGDYDSEKATVARR